MISILDSNLSNRIYFSRVSPPFICNKNTLRVCNYLPQIYTCFKRIFRFNYMFHETFHYQDDIDFIIELLSQPPCNWTLRSMNQYITWYVLQVLEFIRLRQDSNNFIGFKWHLSMSTFVYHTASKNRNLFTPKYQYRMKKETYSSKDKYFLFLFCITFYKKIAWPCVFLSDLRNLLMMLSRSFFLFGVSVFDGYNVHYTKY